MEGLHGDSKVRGVNLGGWLVVEGWIKPSLFDGIPNGDMLVSFLSRISCFIFRILLFFVFWVFVIVSADPFVDIEM